MDEQPFSLAFIMVKESFVVPAIFFYLESANKRYTLILELCSVCIYDIMPPQSLYDLDALPCPPSRISKYHHYVIS